VTNQEWNDERPKPKKRGTHTIEEANAISQKMELLMKKIQEASNFKKDREAIQQYTSARAVEAIQPKPKKRGTHTIEEANAISQKMELLMKKIEEASNFKKDREAIQQHTSARVVEAIQRCEVQEETPEVVSAFDNGQPRQSGPTPCFQGQGNFQKSSWPTLRDIVVNQAKINEGINKRL